MAIEGAEYVVGGDYRQSAQTPVLSGHPKAARKTAYKGRKIRRSTRTPAVAHTRKKRHKPLM